MTITEAGLIDYLTCPMRYAMIWRHGIVVSEPSRCYESFVREDLAALFRLLYTGEFSHARLVADLKKNHPTDSFLPVAERCMFDLACRLRDHRVTGFKAPVKHSIGGVDVILSLDATIEGSAPIRFINTRYHSGLVKTLWTLLAPSSPILLQLSKYVLTPLAVEGWRDLEGLFETIRIGIDAAAFPPRWDGYCRTCGYSRVCDPRWGRDFKETDQLYRRLCDSTDPSRISRIEVQP